MSNFTKICRYVNVTKIFPVGAMLFHAGEREGGWADIEGHDQGYSHFSQFRERA
jgi:hypothetical protein